jgi:hypothetical protein
MSDHYTRDFVWLVVSSPASFQIDFAKCKTLGITGLYYDRSVTTAQFITAKANMPKVGLFETADTRTETGVAVAQRINNDRLRLANNDGGQTPILLDFEPSNGSVQFWLDFIAEYRRLMPGRVTDFTPEPFKATVLPVADLLNARFDVRVQDYFGGMELVDAYEAGLDWIRGLNGIGYPPEQIRSFVDGGRKNKPPIFYNGQVVRKLLGGTCIWNANLMREAGLI